MKTQRKQQIRTLELALDVDLFAAGVLRLAVAEDPVQGLVVVTQVVAATDVPPVESPGLVGLNRLLGVVDVADDAHGLGGLFEGDVLDVGIGRGKERKGDVGGGVDGERHGLGDTAGRRATWI